MCLLGRGFHTLIKNALFSSPTDVGSHDPPPSEPNVLTDTHSSLQSMWDPPIHPLQGPASLRAHQLVSTPLRGSPSSLTHRPMSGSDTIYNNSSSPLAYIVLFGLFLSDFPSKILKRLGKGFNTLNNIAFVNKFRYLSNIPPFSYGCSYYP